MTGEFVISADEAAADRAPKKVVTVIDLDEVQANPSYPERPRASKSNGATASRSSSKPADEVAPEKDLEEIVVTFRVKSKVVEEFRAYAENPEQNKSVQEAFTKALASCVNTQIQVKKEN
jgi:hypothetical protein